ncbi:MAG: RNA-binding transcriptional accessory protein [Acidobacteriota bacterium]|nr:RNA-binding transcriptional accessory protein [Acidobacteriota bacterium]
MSEQKQLPTAILIHIAKQLNVSIQSLLATLALLDGGGTVPFIARYRKEATGNLDEVAIGAIEEKAAYFRELEERRATILNSIEEQGKLTPELKSKIELALDKSVLEDLYLPFKPKRRTKATIAREKGLEPLAFYLANQQSTGVPLSAFAETFVNAEKGVASAAEALEGARHILAEQIRETAEYRSHLRQLMMSEGVVVSRKVEDAKDAEGKFKMYYEYSEPAAKIPSHRMLAIRRGSEENVLYFQIELDSSKPLSYLKSKVVRRPGDWVPQLELALEDAWKRLLNLSIQTEVRLELKERSDTEAIRVFRENLQNLLLSPPAGLIGVLGLDPGLRTGCKIAVVDETGKFLDHGVIYPLEPKNDTAGAAKTLLGFIGKYNVRAISIGNGTGSRESSAFVQDFLHESKLSGIFSVVVNESGASIYSASEIARQEFPDLDLTVRGAISIARRLQDPLAELVKIDPKSIGVGQYQHDVDQRKLNQALESTVETCVNRVGVDLNTASFALLRHVAGINERTAHKIVEFRNENGHFRSRVQLMAVSGFGPKTFEQAAGFLRIRNGDNPLDMTAVHPESYAIVEKIAGSLKVTINELVARPALVDSVKIENFQTEKAGLFTLRDIQEELRKPGRDPRDQFVAPQFKSGVKEISDLTPGMVLEGAVTNVTNFGAFVDIGVHQDGLVHVSELSTRFIKDPYEVVKVGQIVRVQVLSADPKAKRIALSIKALQASELPKIKHGAKPPLPQQQPASLDDKLTRLSNRFRSR